MCVRVLYIAENVCSESGAACTHMSNLSTRRRSASGTRASVTTDPRHGSPRSPRGRDPTARSRVATMRTRRRLALVACGLGAAAAMSTKERLKWRDSVSEMFYHVYDGYKEYAFPHDELRPISRTHTDSLVELGASSPTRANYSGIALTLIDSLDTLAVLGNASEFTWAVQWISENVTFDLDIEVSLFETNIRVLGGLLSAHMLATGDMQGAQHFAVAGYRGELLRLAVDLGERLLSAFDGCGKLPRAFVRLRGGQPKHNGKREQCTAGVGTLLLEFGTLSRLSLDPRFEEAALCALRLLWSKRSTRDLLGNTLDVTSGAWSNPSAGIGAGIDSFYEYALKSYLVFGSAELYGIWNASYHAALTHLRVGPWYGESNMHAGRAEAAAFDSLQAFWPALQVLAGDVASAAATLEAFQSLWTRFRVLPERYDVGRSAVHASMAYYPLRPELAESIHALYRATGESRYLQMGAEMVRNLNEVARTPIGFAGIKSVVDMEQEDHTPSFFLAETLKYLYLLFDDDNFANTHASSFVFSTEGHLIPLTSPPPLPDAAPRPQLELPHGLPIEALPVSRLRQIISSSGLTHADCFEITELRSRAHAATDILVSRRDASAANQRRTPAGQREPLSDELVCRVQQPGDAQPHAPPPRPPPKAPTRRQPPTKPPAVPAGGGGEQSDAATAAILAAPSGHLHLRSVHVHAGPRGVSAVSAPLKGRGRAEGSSGVQLWGTSAAQVDPPRLGMVQRGSSGRRDSISLAIAASNATCAVQLEWSRQPHATSASLVGPLYMLHISRPLHPTLLVSATPFLQTGRGGKTFLHSITGKPHRALRVVRGCDVSGVGNGGLPEDEWIALWLLDPAAAAASSGCTVSWMLSQLALAGADAVLMAEGLRCDGAAIHAASACPSTGGPCDVGMAGWWPPGWHRPRPSLYPCLEGVEGDELPSSISSPNHPIGMLLMPHAAIEMLAAAMHTETDDVGWSVSLWGALNDEAAVVAALPSPLSGMVVERGMPDGGMALRAIVPAGTSADKRLLWQLVLRGHSDGRLSVDVAERVDGEWLSPHTLLSTRQESVRGECHQPDLREGAVCGSDSECGVSGESCERRRCSAYGYCFSPMAHATT